MLSWGHMSPSWTVAVAVAMAVVLLSCDSAQACPAATEASPGFRSLLADCRAYELVSPPYEGGWPVLWNFNNPPPMSPDGDHVLGIDFAGFAGAENDEQAGVDDGAVYEFSRTSTGWTAEALEPPASLAARRGFVVGSADLSRSLWQLSVQAREGEEVAKEEDDAYAVREAAPAGPARFTDLGPEDPPQGPSQNDFVFEGASHDLTHVLFGIRSRAGELWPGDTTREGASSLYEYVGTGNLEPALVGVKNEGPLAGGTHLNERAELISACGTILGSAGEASAYNAISADGAIVYFTALSGAGCPAVDELYARVDGSRTVAVSEPAMTAAREAQCSGACREDENAQGGSKRAPAVFQGASEGGSKVFFTTAQPLLNGDGDTTSDLYEAELGEAGLKGLVQVSSGEGPTPGSGAEVTGVARISADGSHVYFVARGVLSARPRGSEKAQAGGYNLYLYDTSTGRTSFVAALMTSQEDRELQEGFTSELQAVCEAEYGLPEQLEEKEACEAAIPTQVAERIAEKIESKETGPGLTTRDERPFETTPNGQFLIFESPRQLTGAEDTSTVRQLFEYDAQTESLVRVSVGQEGYNDDGNTANAEDAPTIAFPEYVRAMRPTEPASHLSLSEDGRVFFASRDALAPQAIEGRENIYEYSDGGIYLISPGDEAAPLQTEQSRLLGVDESGGDAFFFTTDSLVPQDVDTQASWYDARELGGFPAPPAAPGCAAEGCRGPLSAAPPAPAAGGSAAIAAEGDLVPKASKRARRHRATAGRKRKRRKSRRRQRKKTSGGRPPAGRGAASRSEPRRSR